MYGEIASAICKLQAGAVPGTQLSLFIDDASVGQDAGASSNPVEYPLFGLWGVSKSKPVVRPCAPGYVSPVQGALIRRVEGCP